jgi:peptidoglycan hydrolase CwlO-like protein
MRRLAWKVLVLAAGVLFIAPFVGCNEENLSDVRKSRLIASENRQLRKEVKSQQERLDKCLQEKETSRKGLQSMLEFLMGENKKLREENEELKGQIEELRKEVKKL